MERRDIPRERVHLRQESGTSPKPFEIGESLKGVYPHTTSDGKQHKGNFVVKEISGMGYDAIASCANECGLQIEVHGI